MNEFNLENKRIVVILTLTVLSGNVNPPVALRGYDGPFTWNELMDKVKDKGCQCYDLWVDNGSVNTEV